MSNAWGVKVDSVTAAKRAGGRRRYNAGRKAKAIVRRMQLRALIKSGGYARGRQSEYAKQLGVSRSVVCRDLKIVLATSFRQPCRCCGQAIPTQHDIELKERVAAMFANRLKR